MSRLVVTLPLNDGLGEMSALRALLQRVSSDNPDSFLFLRTQMSGSIKIGFEEGAAMDVPLLTDGAANVRGNSEARVEITAGMHLQPSSGERILSFLNKYPISLDHIGLTLAEGDIKDATWRQLIVTLSAKLPIYRLDVGSPNDILMIVPTDLASGGAQVFELVRDRSVAQSSFHFCLRVDAPRTIVEAEFPPPFGGYKPGDESFFRSVAFLPELLMPAFIDFAFEDGAMTPWPQIVEKMGTRISA